MCCMQVVTDVNLWSLNIGCTIWAIQCLQWRTDARSPASPDLPVELRMGCKRHMSTCDRDKSTCAGPRTEDESNAVSDMKSILPTRSLMRNNANKVEQHLNNIDAD